MNAIRLVPAALLALIVGAAAVVADRADGPPAGAAISDDEFDRLRQALDLKREPWAALPWQVSVTEARRVAFEQNKPIFMQVNTGNCLGFV